MTYDVTIELPPVGDLISLRASNAGRHRIGDDLEFAPPAPGRSATDGTTLWLPVAADEWLLVVEEGNGTGLFHRLDALLHDGDGAVVMASDAHRLLRLRGQHARQVMVQIVPLDLDDAAFAPCAAARMAFGRSSALVHRPGAADGYDIYIESTLVRYGRRLLETCAGRV